MCYLKDVADELGVSKQRVHQIEQEALKKLRIALEARGITQQDVKEYFANKNDYSHLPENYGVGKVDFVGANGVLTVLTRFLKGKPVYPWDYSFSESDL